MTRLLILALALATTTAQAQPYGACGEPERVIGEITGAVMRLAPMFGGRSTACGFR